MKNIIKNVILCYPEVDVQLMMKRVPAKTLCSIVSIDPFGNTVNLITHDHTNLNFSVGVVTFKEFFVVQEKKK